jgi:hypothetical protein
LNEVEYPNLIGLEVKATSESPSAKYLLIGSKTGSYAFSRGQQVWNSAQTYNTLLESAVNDSRCTLYAFDDLKELAKWLLN